MHDPNTVAHEFGRGIFEVTIWHVDPEAGGDDNSCDWFGSRMPVHIWEDMQQLPEQARRAVKFLWFHHHHRLNPRPWWKHPKWHIHHWRVQVHVIQALKRWLFARCSKCGGRFKWREGAVGNWGGGEIWHIRCSQQARDGSPLMDDQ
jgi:hypothetical protein